MKLKIAIVRQGLAAVFLCFFMIGCAQERLRIVWPLPPLQPEIEFVGIYATENDFTRKAQDIWTDAVSGDYESVLGRPFGVVANTDGRVYIADNFSNGIFCFDFTAKKIYQFNALSKFGFILDLEKDARGNLYAVDGLRKIIHVFDAQGNPLFLIDDEKYLESPSYITIDNNLSRIYVSQGRQHKISAFTLSGDFIFEFGGPGTDKGFFAAPQGLAVDKNSRLFVADMLNSRIQVFDKNGQYLYDFEFVGDAFTGYENPKDIEFGPDGNLYIVDQRKALLVSYSIDGKYRYSVGGNTRTTHPLGFSSPSALDIDSEGKIYITDQLNKRLTIWQIMTDKYKKINPLSENDKKNIARMVDGN